ncbi:restriction endonuclease [Streptomyces nogalater]
MSPQQRQHLLEGIRNLSGREFEKLIASLLERDGYEVQRAHGGAGDRGADVIATGSGGERIVVQCKLEDHRPPRSDRPRCRHSTERPGRTTRPRIRSW